jgi:hypothetical protein
MSEAKSGDSIPAQDPHVRYAHPGYKFLYNKTWMPATSAGMTRRDSLSYSAALSKCGLPDRN